MTLDITSRYAAVAFEQGNIRVYRLIGDSAFDLFYRVELGERNGKHEGATRSLAFDATRSWLAILREGNLSIWDLRLGRNQLYLSMPSRTGKLLTYDPLGTFLLIGTEDTLNILDLHSKMILEQYPTTGLSSLAFSPDGRMVIWGDEQGMIHLWGAPQK
jgi:WD40 repeat protein